MQPDDLLKKLEGEIPVEKAKKPKSVPEKASSQKVRAEFIKWFRKALSEIAEHEDDPEKIAWMAWQVAWAKAYESGRKVGGNQARWSSRRKR